MNTSGITSHGQCADGKQSKQRWAWKPRKDARYDFEWKYELPKELRIVIKNYEERYTTTPTKDIMTGCGADRERERESGIDDGFALGQLLKNGGLPVVGACDCPRPPC